MKLELRHIYSINSEDQDLSYDGKNDELNWRKNYI